MKFRLIDPKTGNDVIWNADEHNANLGMCISIATNKDWRQLAPGETTKVLDKQGVVYTVFREE